MINDICVYTHPLVREKATWSS